MVSLLDGHFSCNVPVLLAIFQEAFQHRACHAQQAPHFSEYLMICPVVQWPLPLVFHIDRLEPNPEVPYRYNPVVYYVKLPMHKLILRHWHNPPCCLLELANVFSRVQTNSQCKRYGGQNVLH